MGGCRKTHNLELHNLHPSRNIKLIKYKMRWGGMWNARERQEMHTKFSSEKLENTSRI